MDYQVMLFKVLREHPKEITKLEISQNKEALLELLPHAPACYLYLDKSLRADKEILLAALNDVFASKEKKQETEQEKSFRLVFSDLLRRKKRDGDWYDYHANSNQWRIKVPASLKKDVDFMTEALSTTDFATQIIEHELSQTPAFLVRLAELHGVKVFALTLDGELLRKATEGNRPGDLNIEDSVAQRIYDELKAGLEKKSLSDTTPQGKINTGKQFKV